MKQLFILTVGLYLSLTFRANAAVIGENWEKVFDCPNEKTWIDNRDKPGSRGTYGRQEQIVIQNMGTIRYFHRRLEGTPALQAALAKGELVIQGSTRYPTSPATDAVIDFKFGDETSELRGQVLREKDESGRERLGIHIEARAGGRRASVFVYDCR